MAFPLLPLLLIIGAGAGVAALVAAKNVRGEEVKPGQRAINVWLQRLDGSWSYILIVDKKDDMWKWIVPDWSSEYGFTGNSGEESSRKDAFNIGFSELMKLSNYEADIDQAPSSAGVQIDFYTPTGKAPDELGEDLIFRVAIVPTAGGWLAQITDPSATVKFMKVFKSRSAAIHETYAFVEKKGY